MRRACYLVTSVLFAALTLMAGCGDAENDSAGRQPMLSSSFTPCMVALAPHDGARATDRIIIKLQEKLLRTDKPAVLWERLGWAFVAKARQSFDSGFYHLAEQTAFCMALKQPASEAALLLRGHALHNLHRFREAEILARHLTAQRGLWFDYGLLGDVLMEQGRLDQAVAAYQQMMNQKPGPVAYSRAAHMRWLTGDLAGAIDAMTLAARATRSFRETGAWIATRLALYEMQAGRLSRAGVYLDQVLKPQPDYAPALLARGRWLLAGERYREALVPLTRAVALNPLPEYRWTLIEALQQAGEDSEAHLVQLRQRGPMDDPRSYALYLATTGDDSALAVKLMRAELKNRADVFTLDAYAWALLAEGRIAKSHALIKQALAHGTEDARLFLHAGLIAQAAGDGKAAKGWLNKAAAIKQMLLPSERVLLSNAFAEIPQINPLAGQ